MAADGWIPFIGAHCCEGRRRDGLPCERWVPAEYDYCPLHNPELLRLSLYLDVALAAKKLAWYYPPRKLADAPIRVAEQHEAREAEREAKRAAKRERDRERRAAKKRAQLRVVPTIGEGEMPR